MDTEAIKIQKINITHLETDCIVNAANTFLAPGGGVCGAIFAAAGYDQLREACWNLGNCETGNAVITPGFELKARYIIHAVGPIWHDGQSGERQDLYDAYQNSLKLAKENRCHSIGFPLISSGIYGYPLEEAWVVALQSCMDFLQKNPDYDMEIIFAVLSDNMLVLGHEALKYVKPKQDSKPDNFTFFWHEDEDFGCFSQWYAVPITIEGITYQTCEQYMMAKKALLFEDMKHYFMILASDNPKECKQLGKLVRNFDHDKWSSCKEEIVYRANHAKFTQNDNLKQILLSTGNRILAEASPYDKVLGIGLAADDPKALDPSAWKGQNLLGNILMMIRKQLS